MSITAEPVKFRPGGLKGAVIGGEDQLIDERAQSVRAVNKSKQGGQQDSGMENGRRFAAASRVDDRGGLDIIQLQQALEEERPHAVTEKNNRGAGVAFDDTRVNAVHTLNQGMERVIRLDVP